MLVVISIILILMGLLVPAFTGIKGGTDVTKTAYDIAGMLDQARAYAMANNTYVFVGIVEVDASADPSVTQSATNSIQTGGRIAMAAVASKDGTRGYDVSTPATWATNYAAATVQNLVPISKLQRFENLHLAGLYSSVGTTGNMARPNPNIYYMIGHNNCTSVTPFDWPLGSAIGAGQYSFTKVINFDPQGVARIQYAANTDNIVQVMEIGLQQTHGNVATPSPSPPTSYGNVAAIQIEGMSGATHIYRP